MIYTYDGQYYWFVNNDGQLKMNNVLRNYSTLMRLDPKNPDLAPLKKTYTSNVVKGENDGMGCTS